MKALYDREAAKTINKLDAPIKQRIRQAVNNIPKGDIKPLKGYTDGRKRLRVGKYRIIFREAEKDNEEVLFIMEIGSRGDIYK